MPSLRVPKILVPNSLSNQILSYSVGSNSLFLKSLKPYKSDASDQCSLSRIWGGIHPPVDDIPGKMIGEKIGGDAFNYALPYFFKITCRSNFSAS